MRGKGLVAAVFLCVCCTGTSSDSAAMRTSHAYGQHLRSTSKTAIRTRRVRRKAPNTSAATWQMPWQIRPIEYGSRSPRERIVEAIVPKTGRVRGTRAAIATIGQVLRPARGQNHTVNACRAVVAKEAAKFGAKEVEAVSAGRERRTAAHNIVAPVKFRITYKIGRKYDVRFTVLRCIVNQKGRLLNAYVPRAKSTH